MRSREELRRYQRGMRRNPTLGESIFKGLLVQAKVNFRTQVIFGFYILDFVLPQHLLAIEIDGPSHVTQRRYDDRRDAFVLQCGLTTVRLDNREVHAATADSLTKDLARVRVYSMDYYYAALANATTLRNRAVKNNRRRK